MTPEEYAEKAITMPWGQSPDNLRKMTATLFREAMTEARELARLERDEAARVVQGQSESTLNAVRSELARLTLRIESAHRRIDIVTGGAVTPAALEARK